MRFLFLFSLASVSWAVEDIPLSATRTYIPPAIATGEAVKTVSPFIAKMSLGDFHDITMALVPQRWGVLGVRMPSGRFDPHEHPPLIGELLNTARDGDIDYFRQSRQGPASAALVQDDDMLARLPTQGQRDVIIQQRYALVLNTFLSRWDSNNDQVLTLAEMSDFTCELIPLSYKRGHVSSRTIVYEYMVGIRYMDVDGNGFLNRVEREIYHSLQIDVSICYGNFSKPPREWSIWEAKARASGLYPAGSVVGATSHSGTRAVQR